MDIHEAISTRPAISGSVENIEDYEVIYLGFPCWYSDMPMILCSFLDSYDLPSRTIAPFVTSGGSGFGSVLTRLQTLEPEADILTGLSLTGSQRSDASDWVGQWLQETGLSE